MVTKEYRPGPKASKAIKFTDSLVEVAYVCESCGTEINGDCYVTLFTTPPSAGHFHLICPCMWFTSTSSSRA
jgi:hypothetical protein